MFGSNYYNGYGLSYNNQYRGFNGSSYNPIYFNYNNYGIFGGHSSDAENRYVYIFKNNLKIISIFFKLFIMLF